MFLSKWPSLLNCIEIIFKSVWISNSIKAAKIVTKIDDWIFFLRSLSSDDNAKIWEAVTKFTLQQNRVAPRKKHS